jgi:hypothetical protein
VGRFRQNAYGWKLHRAASELNRHARGNVGYVKNGDGALTRIIGSWDSVPTEAAGRDGVHNQSGVPSLHPHLPGPPRAARAGARQEEVLLGANSGCERRSALVRSLGLTTFQTSDPGPLILDGQPERHGRVSCNWFALHADA